MVPFSTKIRFWPGLCPGPSWGAYSTPPDPLAGGEGAGCPPPQNPLWASIFSPSGTFLCIITATVASDHGCCTTVTRSSYYIRQRGTGYADGPAGIVFGGTCLVVNKIVRK